MQELHEKSKKVVLIDKRRKAEVTEDRDQAYWFELSRKLPIPQRPKWSVDMSPKELQDNEKEDFLHWRRAMAQIEEDEQVYGYVSEGLQVSAFGMAALFFTLKPIMLSLSPSW